MTLTRNLARRKIRTGLTIAGIAVGIWALVVFGALATKIDLLVSGAHDYFGNKVVISSSAGGGGMFPLSSALVGQAQEVSGVDVAYGEINTMVDHDAKQVGLPDEIVGLDPGADRGRDTFGFHYAAGRALRPDDAGTHNVVLGDALARKNGSTIGSTIRLRDVPFTVVGILEPTLTLPDSQAFMPMAAAQDLYVVDLPQDVARSIVPSQTITHIVVYPTPGTDVTSLAARLEAALPKVTTLTAGEFDETIGSTANLLSAIIVGVGLISLVVGGLSIVNTMAMSVNERTREIGIKRAIGGSRRRIVGELVAESGLIGCIGGLIGLALGIVAVTFANDAGRDSGTALFSLTPMTALSAVLFATVLGMVAGLAPATHAARLDPVSALRHE
jgi:putative ABC transport system permease protein